MSSSLRRNRRPPRDPSAATRPKTVLDQTALKSLPFRQKVQQASEISICGSTSELVGRIPLRKIVSMDRFCVPIFQRRYCWTETQWKTLLEDAVRSATAPQPHSLGRLTCTRTNNNNNNNNNSVVVGVEGRSCILDGQQRFTTVTILLAAIRDTIEQIRATEGLAFLEIIDSINALLFSDMVRFRKFNQQPRCFVGEGEVLDFFRLVPTFCDRRAYYAAILSSTNDGTPLLSSVDRPLQAKRFFLERLQQEYGSLAKLDVLLKSVLYRMTMLYFPIDIHTENDGNNADLMVIYERLALRDATFCKPTRKEEFMSMDGSDMIRNLLLGSFSTESDALEFYREFWLPIEELVGEMYDGTTMASLLKKFLESQKHQDLNNNNDKNNRVSIGGPIGGQIYAEFQAWLADRMLGDSMKAVSVEGKVRQVGNELLDFARCFKNGENVRLRS